MLVGLFVGLNKFIFKTPGNGYEADGSWDGCVVNPIDKAFVGGAFAVRLDDVFDIDQDEKGNIWIATDRGGIQKLSQTKFKTTPIETTINAICADSFRNVFWNTRDFVDLIHIICNLKLPDCLTLQFTTMRHNA